MSKFKHMEFSTDGVSDMQFVAHAEKYTIQQMLQMYIERYGEDQKYSHRLPLYSDVECHTVRYYVKAPEGLSDVFDRGCYSFCAAGQRGSFVVWVINFESLEVQHGY